MVPHMSSGWAKSREHISEHRSDSITWDDTDKVLHVPKRNIALVVRLSLVLDLFDSILDPRE